MNQDLYLKLVVSLIYDDCSDFEVHLQKQVKGNEEDCDTSQVDEISNSLHKKLPRYFITIQMIKTDYSYLIAINT